MALATACIIVVNTLIRP